MHPSFPPVITLPPALPPLPASYSFDIPASFETFSILLTPMESQSLADASPPLQTSSPSNIGSLPDQSTASTGTQLYEPAPSYPGGSFKKVAVDVDDPSLTLPGVVPQVTANEPQSALTSNSYPEPTQNVASWTVGSINNGSLDSSYAYATDFMRPPSNQDLNSEEESMQIDECREHNMTYDSSMEFPPPSYPSGYHAQPTESLAPYRYNNSLDVAMPSPIHPGYTRNASYSYSSHILTRPSSAASIAKSRSPFLIPTTSASSPYDGDDQHEDEQTWNLVPFSLPAKGFPGGRVGGPQTAGSYNQGEHQVGEAAGMFLRSPTPTKRQRTSQACEKCRDRKAKCTGTRPSCARCAGRGIACEYSKEKRVRGPPRGHSSTMSSHTQVMQSTGHSYRSTGPIRTNSQNNHGSHDADRTAQMAQRNPDTANPAYSTYGGPRTRVTSSPARMRPYPAMNTRPMSHPQTLARTRGHSQGPPIPPRYSPLPSNHQGLSFRHRLVVGGNGDLSTSSGADSDSDDRSPLAVSVPLHPHKDQTPSEFHKSRIASGPRFLKVTVPQVGIALTRERTDQARSSPSEPPSSATSSTFARDLSASTEDLSSRRQSDDHAVRNDHLQSDSAIVSLGGHPRPPSPSSYGTPPDAYLGQDYLGPTNESESQFFYPNGTEPHLASASSKWCHPSLAAAPGTSSGFSTGSSSSGPSTASPGSFLFRTNLPQDPPLHGGQWPGAAYGLSQYEGSAINTNVTIDPLSSSTYGGDWNEGTQTSVNDTEFRTWISDGAEHQPVHRASLPRLLDDDAIRAMAIGDAHTPEILSPTLANMPASLSSSSIESVVDKERKILDAAAVAESG